MVSLDLTDIQGNILRAYDYPSGVHVSVSLPEAERGRAFLKALTERVTNAEIWDLDHRTGRARKPLTTLNVALTFQGLAKLDVDDEVLARLPDAFREPIRERAERILGDKPAELWEEDFGTDRADVLVSVAATDDKHLESARGRIWSLMHTHGVAPAGRWEQHVAALKNRRDHFGWADGLGQPAIEGYPPDLGYGGKPMAKLAGQGVPMADGVSWRDIKAGEFVMGYEDEDGQWVDEPLLRNGTFMVYRKLEQDVSAFRRALGELAARYGAVTRSELGRVALEELMAAKLVGRWRDGEAIELAPERPGITEPLEEAAIRPPRNDFRYTDDADGWTCPRGAHIRRANPRTPAERGRSGPARHRIIRRGMPYGGALAPGAADGEKRGLVFICFNADFERQFETIQVRWCNDGNAFGLGSDKDYLVGYGGKATIEGCPPFLVAVQEDLVVTRGCQYLLMPGIDVIRNLAKPPALRARM